jgi:hypothetical protein
LLQGTYPSSYLLIERQPFAETTCRPGPLIRIIPNQGTKVTEMDRE